MEPDKFVAVRSGGPRRGEPRGVVAFGGVVLAELAGVGGYAWEVGKGGARWTFDISGRRSKWEVFPPRS
jgi:hypothetical protein